MDYKQMDEMPEVVAETLRAFAQHLQGKGVAPDFDALDDETLALVDELLPEIAALIADKIVPADGSDPKTEERTVPIDGFRLRQARELLQLSAHELAIRVSARGRTIGGTTVDALEAAVETDVDAALAAAVADVLGVPLEDLRPDDRTLEQAVLQDIKWAHPPVEVVRDPIAVSFESEPLLRLVLSDFGLVARTLVFDMDDVEQLRNEATLSSAAELAAVDGGATTWFLLVAGREPERVTQVVTVEEMRGALIAPDGRRVRAPRMPPVALVDAVRFVFEEVTTTSWDAAELFDDLATSLDIEALAARCAVRGIAEATKTKARGEAKPAALASIAEDESIALKRILVGVAVSDIAPGADFRTAFFDELVNAT